jgi:hypothetical protein
MKSTTEDKSPWLIEVENKNRREKFRESHATLHEKLCERVGIDDTEEYLPCVRYAEGDNFQKFRLAPVYESIPIDARKASPIYLLSNSELRKQRNKDNVHAIPGSSNLINQLQDRCREEGRVILPIYVESDEGDNGRTFYEMRRTLKDFAQKLGVNPGDCRFFYSGGRSIHCHVPLVATSPDELEQMKNIAKEFNRESEGEIDPTIYHIKSQFRMVGVEHHRTGQLKIQVPTHSSESQLNRTVAKAIDSSTTNHRPDTFADLLSESVYALGDGLGSVLSKRSGVGGTSGGSGVGSASGKEGGQEGTERQISHVAGDSSIDTLPSESEMESETVVESTEIPHLKKGGNSGGDDRVAQSEDGERPSDEAQAEIWDRRNNDPYSPYSYTDDRRSVSLFTMKGEVFFEEDSEGEEIAYVPSRIHAAVNGPLEDGIAKFETWENQKDRPVRLSKKDHEKWGFDQGDTILVIGGQSRSSRMIEIPSAIERDSIRGFLLPDSKYCDQGVDGRKQLLEHYEGLVGSSGKNGPYRFDSDADADSEDTDPSPSRAQELQERAEEGDVEDDLSHQDRLHVANRLLANRGKEGAIEWFREQYGTDFDKSLAEKFLNSILAKYPDLRDDTSGVTETSF